MHFVIASAAIFAALTATAWRAQAVNDPSVDCKNNGGTTYEINVCAGRDYTAADDALNAIYKQLAAKYDAGNRTLLRTAQRSWLKYRDDECDYETGLTVGGTIHSTMVTNCDTTLTLDRVKALKAQAACAEGDLACNPP